MIRGIPLTAYFGGKHGRFRGAYYALGCNVDALPKTNGPPAPRHPSSCTSDSSDCSVCTTYVRSAAATSGSAATRPQTRHPRPIQGTSHGISRESAETLQMQSYQSSVSQKDFYYYEHFHSQFASICRANQLLGTVLTNFGHRG